MRGKRNDLDRAAFAQQLVDVAPMILLFLCIHGRVAEFTNQEQVAAKQHTSKE
jgi:hypothetical protein